MAGFSRLISLVLCLAVASACSMSYLPRPGPRVSIVMREGNLAFHREGVFVPAGFLGNGIERAVAGDPAAESHARAFVFGTTLGFGLSTAGLGVALVGAVLPLGFVLGGTTSWGTPTAVSLALLGAGLGLELAGLLLMLNATPRMYDAINVFNDNVEGRLLRTLRSAVPPAAPPGATLPPLNVGTTGAAAPPTTP